MNMDNNNRPTSTTNQGNQGINVENRNSEALDDITRIEDPTDSPENSLADEITPEDSSSSGASGGDGPHQPAYVHSSATESSTSNSENVSKIKLDKVTIAVVSKSYRKPIARRGKTKPNQRSSIAVSDNPILPDLPPSQAATHITKEEVKDSEDEEEATTTPLSDLECSDHAVKEAGSDSDGNGDNDNDDVLQASLPQRTPSLDLPQITMSSIGSRPGAVAIPGNRTTNYYSDISEDDETSSDLESSASDSERSIHHRENAFMVSAQLVDEDAEQQELQRLRQMVQRYQQLDPTTTSSSQDLDVENPMEKIQMLRQRLRDLEGQNRSHSRINDAAEAEPIHTIRAESIAIAEAVSDGILSAAPYRGKYAGCISIGVFFGLVLVVVSIIVIVFLIGTNSVNSRMGRLPPSTTLNATDNPMFPQTNPPTQSELFCFETKEELDSAVELYLKDNRPTTALARLYGHPIGSWCVSKISNFTNLFSSERAPLASVFNEDLAEWDVSSATHMDYMFQGAATFDADLSRWNTSSLKSMRGMFQDCALFHGRGLLSWDVSNVVDMGFLFKDAEAFNGDISLFKTSRVSDMGNMFAGATAFNQNISSWKVNNVVSMDWMFADAVSFNQDLFWDTSSVQSMSFMFSGAINFDGNVSSFDTSKVISLSNMFRGASAFNGDLSHWNVSSATRMESLFQDAVNFTGANIQGWDVSRVTDMGSMFAGAVKFNVDLSTWNIQSALDASNMFAGATQFNQDMCAWRNMLLSGQTAVNLWNAFVNTSCEYNEYSEPEAYCRVCPELESGVAQSPKLNETIMVGAAPSFDANSSSSSSMGDAGPISAAPPMADSNTTVLGAPESSTQYPTSGSVELARPAQGIAAFFPYSCFENGTELRTAVDAYLQNNGPMSAVAVQYGWPIGIWCVSRVSDFSRVFSVGRNPLASIFNEDLSSWNTSMAQDMSYMFYGAASFNGDMSSFMVHNVTTMEGMFYEASSFDKDLSLWDTSNLVNTKNMFRKASAFNSTLSWDVSKVTTMEGMFRDATSFNHDSISLWTVSSVTNMYWMFSGATAFNVDIGSWDTSKVQSISEMFSRAAVFNQNLRRWNTSNVENMVRVFEQASSFNQVLGSWDTAKVTSMSGMFSGASSFQGTGIGSWQVSKVTNFAYMFYNAKSFNEDLGAWVTSSSVDMSHMFDGASSFQGRGIEKWDVSRVSSFVFMFHNAAAFDQNLCSWNILKNPIPDAESIFDGTSCPVLTYPMITKVTAGPLCHYCHDGPCDAFGSRDCYCVWDEVSLVRAIDDYLRDSSDRTAVAATYGYPIGNWCTSQISDVDKIIKETNSSSLDLSCWTADFDVRPDSCPPLDQHGGFAGTMPPALPPSFPEDGSVFGSPTAVPGGQSSASLSLGSRVIYYLLSVLTIGLFL